MNGFRRGTAMTAIFSVRAISRAARSGWLRVGPCAAVLLVAGCGASLGEHATGGLQGKLVVTGSSTCAPLVGEIGKRFEALHPGVRIDVQTGGSSRGIADARRGTAEIGMVSRGLTPAEDDLRAFAIARDGVSLIVHLDNPVRELTDADVVAIYTGQVRSWRAVGGRDAPITVVTKAEGRATLEVFRRYFGLENRAIRADVVIGDNEQGVKTVAGNPDAIGYVSMGTAEYDSQHGVPIKLLPGGGVPASTASLTDGTFPISRPLNLVTRGDPTGLTRAFIEFCQSKGVHDLIAAQYLVPTAL